MAYFCHRDVGLKLCLLLPQQVFTNLTDNPHFTREDAEAIVEKTGFMKGVWRLRVSALLTYVWQLRSN